MDEIKFNWGNKENKKEKKRVCIRGGGWCVWGRITCRESDKIKAMVQPQQPPATCPSFSVSYGLLLSIINKHITLHYTKLIQSKPFLFFYIKKEIKTEINYSLLSLFLLSYVMCSLRWKLLLYGHPSDLPSLFLKVS